MSVEKIFQKLKRDVRNGQTKIIFNDVLGLAAVTPKFGSRPGKLARNQDFIGIRFLVKKNKVNSD